MTLLADRRVSTSHRYANGSIKGYIWVGYEDPNSGYRMQKGDRWANRASQRIHVPENCFGTLAVCGLHDWHFRSRWLTLGFLTSSYLLVSARCQPTRKMNAEPA